MELKRRDSAVPGHHEFYIEDGGEEYVLLRVKNGRVEKQKRLAAERAAQAPTPPSENG